MSSVSIFCDLAHLRALEFLTMVAMDHWALAHSAYLLCNLEDGRDVPLRPHERRVRFNEDTMPLAVVDDRLLLVQGLELRKAHPKHLVRPRIK